MSLTRVTGPACPRCECEDCESLRCRVAEARKSLGGDNWQDVERVTEQLQCNNCGHRWTRTAMRELARKR